VKRVVIIGAGGHAREVHDIFAASRRNGVDVDVVGFIDEASTRTSMCGLPILGGFEWFKGVDRSEIGVICAVGTPKLNNALVQKAQSLNLQFVTAVSPLACISPAAKMGHGAIVFPHVFVSCDVIVGNYSTLNVGSTLSHDVRVGDYCCVSPGAHLAGNVALAEGCFVGMGANIIQGVSIGGWSVVGAGAVVLDDVPPKVTAAGVPARVVNYNATPFPQRPVPGRPAYVSIPAGSSD
jgi:sugar O-acyltransferase (sialic acid O-acetyltransferase NeuD family)